MKLVVISLTVLALAMVHELGKTQRLILELDDRYNARLFSEYVRQRSQADKPTLQIIPEWDESGTQESRKERKL